MPECPECGAHVPSDGRFCPECGRDLAREGEQRERPSTRGSHRRDPEPREPSRQDASSRPSRQSKGQRRQQGTRQGRTDPPRNQSRPRGGDGGYARQGQEPGYGAVPRGPAPTNHKLLVGSVLALAAVGLIEGVIQALYPEIFVEFLEEEGFGFEADLSAEVFVITGTLGVLVALVVTGATVYFYREGAFRKAYFWLLIGTGVAGFFLVGSLFLTLLVAFGIYGLIWVMD